MDDLRLPVPDCRYCDASFEDDEAYVDHLAADHEGGLGAVDQRRVDSHVDDGGRSVPVTPLVLGVVLLGVERAGVRGAACVPADDRDVPERPSRTRARASLTMPRLTSRPTTWPSGPTASLTAAKLFPGPQPTSGTRSPGDASGVSRAVRRIAASLPRNATAYSASSARGWSLHQS